jgi:hypothetical protein
VAHPDPARVAVALLDRHGRTYAEDAGIRLRDTPAPLFQLLCLSLMLSARIRGEAAVSGARALFDTGWTTPDHLAASTWEQRVKVLNENGYARYDESTARMLAQTTDLLLDRYDGDLRQLRAAADGDVATVQRLLEEFTGMGSVGAAIYCREVQLVWDEVRPFADDRALQVAERLGLGSDPEALEARTDSPEELTRLVAALVRCGLDHDEDAVLEAASS